MDESRHHREQRVSIDATQLAAPADLHAFLKAELGFPDYYGANLAALADCLSDIDRPVCLVLEGQPVNEAMRGYLERAATVMARCARENPHVSFKRADGR